MRQSGDLLKLGLVGVGSMLLTTDATLALQPAQPSVETAAVVGRALDLLSHACRNVYQRACGGFIASAKPTESRHETYLFDNALYARLQVELEQLFREPAGPGSEVGGLKTFYASCRQSMTERAADHDAFLRT